MDGSSKPNEKQEPGQTNYQIPKVRVQHQRNRGQPQEIPGMRKYQKF